jgi:hypothetical protein
MATRVDDIVQDVITELSQVPGVATQLYASDRIRQFVQSAWLLEIEEMWWPDYMMWFNIPIDGVTGMLTQDLVGPISSISDFGDIAMVMPSDSNKRLRILPPGMNPFTFVSSSGRPVYMAPDYSAKNRPFKVYPATATGNVAIWARQRNAVPFSSDDLVYLDRLLLMYDAAWMYSIDDGTVPAQATKYQQLAVKRRKQMMEAFAQQPLALDPRFPDASIMDGIDNTTFTVGVHPIP